MACNLILLFVHFADRKRCISKCKICHWRCANSQEKSQLKLEPNIASDTLSDINLFLPGSAGRDVTAIFNISFSRNKTVGVIYFFSKSLDGCTQEAVSVYPSANIQIMLQCAA